MISSEPTVLFDLIHLPNEQHPAIALPGSDLRIKYTDLRNQIEALAEALAAAGVSRGDRVAMALPNGLAAVVCFLASSVAGTAAPLNPAYTEDEFRFYLEDLGARTLIVPSEGADAARAAAGSAVRVLTAAVDAAGTVRFDGVSGRRPISPPDTPTSGWGWPVTTISTSRERDRGGSGTEMGPGKRTRRLSVLDKTVQRNTSA